VKTIQLFRLRILRAYRDTHRYIKHPKIIKDKGLMKVLVLLYIISGQIVGAPQKNGTQIYHSNIPRVMQNKPQNYTITGFLLCKSDIAK